MGGFDHELIAAEKKWLEGVCDLKESGDPRVSWDSTCDRFEGRQKDILFEWERFLDFYESADIILSTKYNVKVVRKSQDCVPEESTFQEIRDLLSEAAKRHRVGNRQTIASNRFALFSLGTPNPEALLPEVIAEEGHEDTLP